MKSMLVSLALVPLLLTGCASSGGYSSSSPGSSGYAYPVAYYDGPYHDSGPPRVAATSPAAIAHNDGGGSYQNDYHIADIQRESQVASVSHSTPVAVPTSTASLTASASSGKIHTGNEKTLTSNGSVAVDNQ